MTEFLPPPSRPRPAGSRPAPRPQPEPEPDIRSGPEPEDRSAPEPEQRPAPEPGNPPAPEPEQRPEAEQRPEPEPAAAQTRRVPRAAASRRDRRRAEQRAGRRVRQRQLRVALALFAAIAVAASVVLVVLQFRDDTPAKRRAPATPSPTVSGARLAQPDLATSFLAGAASDIAAVTTYDYRALDDALSAGSAVTTGAYQRAYRAALTGELATTALQNHVVHTFETLELGVGEMNAAGTQAKVLVFGRERVSDIDTHDGARITPVTLCATIRKEGDRFLISDLVENANAGLPPGGADLQVAAEVGRSEVVNLLSYRRADFEADVQRAVAGSVSPLSEQIQSNAADTAAAMRKGNYDLNGTVTAVALERASGDSLAMLVAAQSTKVTDGAAAPTVSPVRYVVTVTRTDRGWAVSQVRSVDGT